MLSLTNAKQGQNEVYPVLEKVPLEIWSKIFSYLELEHLMNCDRVCRIWQQVVRPQFLPHIAFPQLIQPTTDMVKLLKNQKFAYKFQKIPNPSFVACIAGGGDHLIVKSRYDSRGEFDVQEPVYQWNPDSSTTQQLFKTIARLPYYNPYPHTRAVPFIAESPDKVYTLHESCEQFKGSALAIWSKAERVQTFHHVPKINDVIQLFADDNGAWIVRGLLRPKPTPYHPSHFFIQIDGYTTLGRQQSVINGNNMITRKPLDIVLHHGKFYFAYTTMVFIRNISQPENSSIWSSITDFGPVHRIPSISCIAAHRDRIYYGYDGGTLVVRNAGGEQEVISSNFWQNSINSQTYLLVADERIYSLTFGKIYVRRGDGHPLVCCQTGLPFSLPPLSKQVLVVGGTIVGVTQAKPGDLAWPENLACLAIT